MAQISKGDTFVDGEQVTGARLNQLVDSAHILVGAITDQPNLTANTLEATDSILVNDSGTLKEATIGDILGSSLPITTSAISGNGGVDLVITPPSGKKLDVAGAFEADSINSVGAATIGGNLTVTGATTHTGTTTHTGNVTVDNGFTSNGTANFTGVLQVNGTVGYVLYELLEETIAPWTAVSPGNYNGVYTSSAFTKPTGEIWVFEVSYNLYGDAGYSMALGGRYASQTAYTGTYKFAENHTVSTHSYAIYHKTQTWTEGTSVALSAETLKIDTYAGASSYMQLFFTSTTGTAYGIFSGYTTAIAPSKFRIYKYKTA
jgi:hypothetical protein